MTSYSHYNDEAFKIYVAQKISEGSKFVVLQMDTVITNMWNLYEKRICDNYISEEIKILIKRQYLFITTNVGKKVIKKNSKGILIKITEFQLIPWKSTYA